MVFSNRPDTQIFFVSHEMPGFKGKNIEFLQIFTALKLWYDAIFAFFGCCDAISSHFTIFLGSKYWKVIFFFQFQNQANPKGFYVILKTYFYFESNFVSNTMKMFCKKMLYHLQFAKFFNGSVVLLQVKSVRHF